VCWPAACADKKESSKDKDKESSKKKSKDEEGREKKEKKRDKEGDGEKKEKKRDKEGDGEKKEKKEKSSKKETAGQKAVPTAPQGRQPPRGPPRGVPKPSDDYLAGLDMPSSSESDEEQERSARMDAEEDQPKLVQVRTFEVFACMYLHSAVLEAHPFDAITREHAVTSMLVRVCCLPLRIS